MCSSNRAQFFWIIACVLFIVGVVFLPRWGTISTQNETIDGSQRRRNGTQQQVLATSDHRVYNKLRTEYDSYAAETLSAIAARKATGRDPQAVDFARYLMDAPSGRMRKIPPAVDGAQPSPQEAVVDAFLKEQTGGFFVEAGAYDGSEGSNTLFLEVQRKWTGLLVEMDPSLYTQIIGKQRNAWSINACLSLQPFATKSAFEESRGMLGRLTSSKKESDKRIAPCFPVETLLRALNRTTVDYFSLDVEGAEFDVLKALPFDQLSIRTISVEYLHSTHSRQNFIDLMVPNGYRLVKDLQVHKENPFVFAHDLIFARDFS